VTVSCNDGDPCCAGNLVEVEAVYEGACPPSLFIQVDLDDDAGCTLCDDLPTTVNPFCTDQCSIDGVSAASVCAGGLCSGTFMMPGSQYAVDPPECRGADAAPTLSFAYENDFPCNLNPTQHKKYPIAQVFGGISFGSTEECYLMCTDHTP